LPTLSRPSADRGFHHQLYCRSLAAGVTSRSIVSGTVSFILLNLFLDAGRSSPVIMMSQIRQDTKDRLRGELRLRRQSPGGSEIQGLARSRL
jgi:hypothetical protein